MKICQWNEPREKHFQRNGEGGNYWYFFLNHRFSCAMDVIDDDVGEGIATLVSLSECILPSDVIVYILKDIDEQCQWYAIPFLKHLFKTNDEEKLRTHFSTKMDEVRQIHELLWPGFQIPPIFISKHEKDMRDNDDSGHELQTVFLKQKSMTTSWAMSWLFWAISKERRMPPDRAQSQAFIRTLFSHVLQRAGSLSLRLAPAGGAGGVVAAIRISMDDPFISSRYLWDRVLRTRISHEWESRRVCAIYEQVTSPYERPHWIDFLVFGCDPSIRCSYLLKPLVCSIVSQVAKWMDDNMSRLALEIVTRNRSKQKTAAESKAVLKHVLVEAACFYLYENDNLICFGNFFSVCSSL